MTEPPIVAIPAHLLPSDGRFGSGPTRVRDEQVAVLSGLGRTLLGTSHRQAPVRSLVASVRAGVAQLLGVPDGYEVVLGNGGSTALWDALAFCLVRERAQCAAFGEFGAKFAKVLGRAPFLADVNLRDAPAGELAVPFADEAAAGVDVFAHPHNETSTGVVSPVTRIGASSGQAAPDALTVVDATSAAGAVRVDLAQTDVYYFAPQKVFGADGGLWVAVVSPAALERIGEVTAGRWVPDFLDLSQAVANSRKDQTLNTPAIATLVLLDQQLAWLNDNGGMDFAAGRAQANAAVLYGWAQASSYARPFVRRPEWRSPVVGTIDLDESVDHAELLRHLRGNGIVDAEPYRKLGRNQIRVGMFPAVPTSDVEALTACIDHVVDRLG